MRDWDDLPPNSTGQQTPQAEATVAPATQRAANTLREVANATLVVLESLAGLLDRAGRGETIPAGDLTAMQPAVNASKTAMQGVVAGFAANDLCAELQQTQNRHSTTATWTEQVTGTRKTYAQAANAVRNPSQ